MHEDVLEMLRRCCERDEQPYGCEYTAAAPPPFPAVDGGRKDRGRGNPMRRLTPFWRAVTEVGFILFLFYSNLLMGEFTRANSAHGKTFAVAVADIFTVTNFAIGVISALIGYAVVEYLRKKL
jgi:hypothetical protein